MSLSRDGGSRGELLPGARLGPYEIVAFLGAGGMGEVYRARDERLHREVAIKVLPRELSSDDDRLHRFEKEAISASALNHPNIVTIHEVGRSGSRSYIVMELVEGATLHEILAGGALPVRRLLGLAVQIASGLARAHAAGIVHRDLKPENVMVTGDGFAKILDFGLAKLVRPEQSAGQPAQAPTVSMKTAVGAVLGTVGYMSPEQASGHPVDYRSDQFSLGSILYEMATGKRAFQRGTSAQTLAAIIQEEPELITTVAPNLPPPLRWIIERCHAKEPGERYVATEDLARDLSNARDRLSESSGSGESVSAGISRRGTRVAVGVAVATALAGLVAGFFAGKPVWSSASVEPATFRRLTFRRGTLFGARFAPDGQTIVYSAAWEGTPIQLYSTRAEGGEGRSLGLPEGLILGISSGGEMALGLVSADRRVILARAPLAGGAPRPVLEGVEAADWAPAGRNLAAVRQIGQRQRLEFPIGKPLREAARISHVRVSPGGDAVAFLEQETLASSASVALVDLAGKKKDLSSGWRRADGLAWSPAGDEVWFSGYRGDALYGLHAVTLGGRERVIARAPVDMILEDISHDGRALMQRTVTTVETFGLPPGQIREREYAWMDRAQVAQLSADGKTLLYALGGEGEGEDRAIYLRKTDGSTAVRLGEGSPRDLSPNGDWVLAAVGRPARLVLLPTGVGEPERLASGDVELQPRVTGFSARWLPDGRRILFSGRAPGRKARCYLQDIGGGTPRPVGPEELDWCGLPTPDGKFFVGEDRRLYPIDGGKPRSIPGLSKDERWLRWSGDGRFLYVLKRPGTAYRLDVQTGRRELWKEFRPADPSGVDWVNRVVLTPDGRTYFYSYPRVLSDLYLVEGLQ